MSPNSTSYEATAFALVHAGVVAKVVPSLRYTSFGELTLATAKSIKKNLVANGLELKTLNKMKKFV